MFYSNMFKYVSDAPSSAPMSSLKHSAVDAHRGAPSCQMFDVRYPKSLATWVKVHALTHNVSDSAVLRHALEQDAVTNGYDAHR